MTHTETERLDWVFAHKPADYANDLATGEHWIVLRHDYELQMVSGRSYRECIDRAIDGDYKRIG